MAETRRKAQTARLLDGVLSNGGETLQAKVFRGLRQLIHDGALAPGAKVPSTRRLADDLGVARNTVVAALDKLVADGWLETRRGSGTYVAATLPALPPSGAQLRPLPESDAATPFAPMPALDLFPITAWSKLQTRRWRRMPARALQEGQNAGWSGLRWSIATHLRLTRGIRCEPEQVIVTNGAQAAIYLAARVLTRAGDRAWVEDPGYFGAKDALRAQGLVTVSVPVDGEGLNVAAGEAMAPDARLAVVTSHLQFPTGAQLSGRRRSALLQWAHHADAWIVDDGYDCEFSFEGPRLSSLAEAGDERVIYVNSFNKTLFPALRIGYLIAPPPLVDAFAAARSVQDGHSNVPNQMVLHDFLEGGHFDDHMRRCREAYAERREALLAALHHDLAGILEPAPHRAGLQIVARSLHRPALELVERARKADIDLTAMARFLERETADDRVLLGFSGFTPSALHSAARKLARVGAALSPG